MNRGRQLVRCRLRGLDVRSGVDVKRGKLHQASLVGKGGDIAPQAEFGLMRLNRQDAPVKSCFAGPASPAFHQAGKNAKGRSFALRGRRKAKTEPSISLFSCTVRTKGDSNKMPFQEGEAKPFPLP
jgi:hypothetical protein